MLLVICGCTASGKTEISKKLGMKPIISYTTRPIREGEVPDKDYHFISNEKFKEMIDNDEFVEYEEYTQGRFYGTTVAETKAAIESKDMYIAVKTPGGIRALKKQFGDDSIKTALITANLGTKVKRYIDRVGAENFTFDDMNEIYRRVNSDFGQFLNMEKEVDIVIDNSTNDPKDIEKKANEIKERLGDKKPLSKGFEKYLEFVNRVKSLSPINKEGKRTFWVTSATYGEMGDIKCNLKCTNGETLKITFSKNGILKNAIHTYKGHETFLAKDYDKLIGIARNKELATMAGLINWEKVKKPEIEDAGIEID